MSDAWRTIGVRLRPLDVLFFRDGRPFEAAARVSSGLPVPQTVAGMLRTWLLTQAGCDFETLGEAIGAGGNFTEATARQGGAVAGIGRLAFRGPWFMRDGAPLVAAPAVLREAGSTGVVVRLAPRSTAVPGWHGRDGLERPLWSSARGKLSRVDGYFTLRGLDAFLSGEIPAREELAPPADLYDYDRRTGIAVDPTSLTSAEGLIYEAGFLALRPDVDLYAEVAGSDDDLAVVPDEPHTLPFGGEGRRVVVERLPEAAAWPRRAARDGQGTMLVTTSPGLFHGGWKPAWLDTVSAAVPGFVGVSGWDMARGGPKPTRFAVAEGSVYFLDGRCPAPTVPGSLCEGEDAVLGWGAYVEGVWSDV